MEKPTPTGYSTLDQNQKPKSIQLSHWNGAKGQLKEPQNMPEHICEVNPGILIDSWTELTPGPLELAVLL